MIRPATVDFETEPAESRPDYPPEPVGVSIKYPDRPSRYYGWGHPVRNNCTRQEGVAALGEVWLSGAPLLFHHAKFDLQVATEKLGLPLPPPERIHDTMWLLFLFDPHMRKQGLKESAAQLLNWAPEEQDELAAWILERKHEILEAYPHWREINKKTGKPINNIAPTKTGRWIAAAPGDIVGRYACGDTDRTEGLFEALYPVIVDDGMLSAYRREQRALPIFMENEREGIPVNSARLERDIPRYQEMRDNADDWLRQRLRRPSLNLDSDEEYGVALAEEGVVDEDEFTWTEGGKNTPPRRSVSKDNLHPDQYNDKQVALVYGYRNRMGTCLNTFMKPWLAQAAINDGKITTNWHQTRGGDGGTRTGRPSTSNHNFLNLSKDFEGRKDGYTHPSVIDVEPLPLVRKYVRADDESVFVHRDFDSQELRIFAHFESGELMRAYNENPSLDVHAMVGNEMATLAGKEFERTDVKTINFQSLYGGGVPALMRELRISRGEAKTFKNFHNAALPGRVLLNDEIKRIIRSGLPINTLGGRQYFAEEPKRVQGQMRDFIYKLINYLIQGSAADFTKEALIQWHSHPDRHETDRFLVTVYDEINLSAHIERWIQAMKVLRDVMEVVTPTILPLDVPMTSSPKVGWTWGECQKMAKGETEAQFLQRMDVELRKAA